MGAIVAADITAVPMYRVILGQPQNRGADTMMEVCMKVSVVTDVTDSDYVTGGLPLDNLFTAGNASDTGLDTSRPIFGKVLSGALFKGDPTSDAGVTNSMPAAFRNKATGASGQKLWLGKAQANDAGATGIDEMTAATIVGADLLTAVGTHVCFLELKGFKRPGYVAAGVDA